MDNWFKIPRNINEWQHYQEPSCLLVMLDIVRSSYFKDGYSRGRPVKAGQLLSSISRIAESTGLSTSTVKVVIDKLVESGDITKVSTNHGTLFTINQSSMWFCIPIFNMQTTQQGNQPTTQQGNQQLTIDNKEIENDNIKEKENKEKEKHSRFSKPSVEDVAAYCEERKNGIDAQSFIDYYDSVGWMVGPNKHMKDWKASVRTWERNGKNKTKTYKGDDTIGSQFTFEF